MIPLSGFLSRIVSTRWMFSASAVGFTLSSILCGTATSIEEMVVYRALQGFLGGGMIPTTFAASYAMFSLSQRQRIMPLMGVVVPLAPTIGPTVGGWLTDMFSWHWLFYVNVVPGILVALAGATLAGGPRSAQPQLRITFHEFTNHRALTNATWPRHHEHDATHRNACTKVLRSFTATSPTRVRSPHPWSASTRRARTLPTPGNASAIFTRYTKRHTSASGSAVVTLGSPARAKTSAREIEWLCTAPIRASS